MAELQNLRQPEEGKVVIHMEIPPLTGDGILLRKIRESDIDDRLAIGRHHKFVHNCGGETLPVPEYPDRQVWESWYAGQAGAPYTWIIQERGRCIGSAGFHYLSREDRSATYRIGIFDPACHSRGIGTQVTRLLLGYGFDVMGLHRIDLKVLEYNRRAIRCYEKCGFVREGVLRESAYIEGRYYSDILMSILEPEYRAQGNG